MMRRGSIGLKRLFLGGTLCILRKRSVVRSPSPVDEEESGSEFTPSGTTTE